MQGQRAQRDPSAVRPHQLEPRDGQLHVLGEAQAKLARRGGEVGALGGLGSAKRPVGVPADGDEERHPEQQQREGRRAPRPRTRGAAA